MVFNNNEERTSYITRLKSEYDNFIKQYGAPPASGVARYMAGQLNLPFDVTTWTRKESQDALAA